MTGISVPTGRALVTGGTGSLGKAIVARAKCEAWPVEFTIYSRDEVKQGQMRVKHPECSYKLGDVRDLERLQAAMRGQDIVLHCGAQKVVPDAEVNTDETVKTNVLGSMNVATAAIRTGVKQVIGISTDKACGPVNAYGQSKALMEKLFQQADKAGDTQFNLTRYGNVVGSRGSVVPFFQRQAREGKRLTITDFRMTRFWLTLNQAVDLILLALAEPEGGTIVVPKAPAMRVVDVARIVAPHAELVDIGIRPGEKVHESLIQSSEAYHTDDCGSFFRVYPATSQRKGTMLPETGKEQYTSQFPSHWLEAEEMAGMIAESGEEE